MGEYATTWVVGPFTYSLDGLVSRGVGEYPILTQDRFNHVLRCTGGIVPKDSDVNHTAGGRV